jgi:hypothetical protein
MWGKGYNFLWEFNKQNGRSVQELVTGPMDGDDIGLVVSVFDLLPKFGDVHVDRAREEIVITPNGIKQLWVTTSPRCSIKYLRILNSRGEIGLSGFELLKFSATSPKQ